MRNGAPLPRDLLLGLMHKIKIPVGPLKRSASSAIILVQNQKTFVAVDAKGKSLKHIC